MSCPDYYLLASGREFIDFANNELAAWLKPRVNHEVYHCIISAMEHRFRRGNKEGEAESVFARIPPEQEGQTCLQSQRD